MKAISGGQFHALALRSDGVLIEWGNPNVDAVPIPPSSPNVIALAAGGRHDVALLNDGRVIAWGRDWLGQATVPNGLQNVSAIAAGFSHSLALVGDRPPRIIQQPRGITGIVGGNARLTVRAGGSQPIRYQWRQNGSDMVGATNVVLALDGLSMFDNGNYEVVAVNSQGAVTSQVANISVVTRAPFDVSIHTLPANRTAVLGGSAEFSAQAQGTPPFGYRWFFDGQPLFAARNATLRLDALRLADAGDYSVTVVNPFGSITSAPVRLSVVNVAAWGALDGGSDRRVFDVPLSLTDIVALSPSQWAVLGLRKDASAVGWGDPGSGRVPPPASATNLTALAAGGEFGLGLRADGSVIAWGNNSFGIQPLPAGLANVIQICAAYSWALALKADGTVVQWGTYIGGWMKPPPPMSNVVQIAAGQGHALALLRDGTVVGWGSDDCHQVNPPAGLSNVIAIVANDSSLALRDDGTVVEWGCNSSTPPTEASNLVSIATGNFHRVGLRDDGRVFTWGFYNGHVGQVAVPTDLPPVIAIAAGGDATFAIVPATGEPHIARHPRRQTLSSGGRLQLETRLFPGSSNVTFQWFKDGVEILGQTEPILVRESSSASDSGRYRVVARNAFGVDASREAEVLITDLPPRIVAGPQDAAVDSGANAWFAVIVEGSFPLSYQWFFDNAPLLGATNDALFISTVDSTKTGGYSIAVSNAFGQDFSRVATLRLRQVPAIQTAAMSFNSIGQFRFLIHGEPGDTLVVQWSENLRDWQDTETFTLGDSPVQWTDIATRIGPQRFYRVVPPRWQ